jgi:hypothetical protein
MHALGFSSAARVLEPMTRKESEYSHAGSIRYRQGHISDHVRPFVSSVFARMRSFRMMATVAFIFGM